jgi:hypothetical protein
MYMVPTMIKVREQNTPLVYIPIVYDTYHDKGKRTKHITSFFYHGMYHILKEWKQVVCVVLLPLSWYVPCTKGMETSDVCC